MALISWSDSLSVGVLAFDNQHKRLIAIINKLHDAMKEGRGKEVLDGILLELVDYTVYHFLAEEKAFLDAGYLDYVAHKREHDAFTATIKAARGSSSTAATLATMKQLTDWLKQHIMGSDKKYAAHFAGRKLAA
jgi:hemerythrin